jgi:threonine dehydrogenase-like Zn-dependent dehydrogenase
MAGLGVGDVVAVIGLGMIGQLVAQIARAKGAVVIALDLRPDRIALAERLGADHAFAPGDEAERRIAALTSGRGADCVIVAAAAKSSAPVELALRLCRERGKVVVVGAVEMNLSRDLMYVKEIDVVVSRAYGRGYDPGTRSRRVTTPRATCDGRRTGTWRSFSGSSRRSGSTLGR